MLSCRQASVGHLGVESGAIWLVIQRPGHVLDMRVLAVSHETAGSDTSESMAVSLSDPLD
jgi:hypothetical protein